MTEVHKQLNGKRGREEAGMQTGRREGVKAQKGNGCVYRLPNSMSFSA